jgi:pyruvate,water dikinase
MWATGGPPIGPQHWPPIVRRRRDLLKRLEAWTPPPALGSMPEAVNDPMVVMLWGVTPARLQEWAQAQDGAQRLQGAAASAGVAEGPARVLNDPELIGTIEEGEILVCTITSPAWAPIFPKIKATVTDIGGVMSHAAIVSREYGKPAVVGTGRATATIKTGQMLHVDGSTGVVTILGDTAGAA